MPNLASALRPTSLDLVLAATDGSATAEHALAVARGLAGRAGATLDAVSVDTGHLPASAESRPVSGPELPFGPRQLRGLPGVEISRRAELTHAGLVVLGRTVGGPGDGTLGRTIEAVVRRRDGLSLLIPPGIDRLTRMVIALDGTTRGLGVLEPALRLAREIDVELLPLHVMAGEAVTASGDGWGSPAVRRLRTAVDAARLGAPLALRSGRPVAETLGYLDTTGADLLAVGVRRGWAPGDLGSGHIGRDLLRTAPVAILTVPI